MEVMEEIPRRSSSTRADGPDVPFASTNSEDKMDVDAPNDSGVREESRREPVPLFNVTTVTSPMEEETQVVPNDSVFSERRTDASLVEDATTDALQSGGIGSMERIGGTYIRREAVQNALIGGVDPVGNESSQGHPTTSQISRRLRKEESDEDAVNRLKAELNAKPKKSQFVDICMTAQMFTEWREACPPFGGILIDESESVRQAVCIDMILKQFQSQMEKCRYLALKVEDEATELLTTDFTLVVCYADNELDDWAKKFEEKVPDVVVIKHHGEKRARTAEELTRGHVLTTYGVLRNDIDIMTKVYWVRAIMSEGHCIKDKATKQTQASKRLKACHRWVVTPAPIQNTSKDCFALCSFLLFQPFWNWSFWNKYVVKKKSKEEEVRALLSFVGEFIALRITNIDVQMSVPEAERLPEMKTEVVYIEMAEAEREFYKEMEEDGDELSLTIDKQTRLRQICIHSHLIVANLRKNGQHVCLTCEARPVFSENYESSKFRMVLNILRRLKHENEQRMGNLSSGETHRMEKVLIVSDFCKPLEMLNNIWLPEFNKVLITGAVEPKKRKKLVNKFNDAVEGVEILLWSVRASLGDCVLTGAKHVIVLDPHYNPQLLGGLLTNRKVHCMGQTNEVLVKKLKCLNTIEEYVSESHQWKQDVANGLISEHPIKKESLEKIVKQRDSPESNEDVERRCVKRRHFRAESGQLCLLVHGLFRRAVAYVKRRNEARTAQVALCQIEHKFDELASGLNQPGAHTNDVHRIAQAFKKDANKLMLKMFLCGVCEKRIVRDFREDDYGIFEKIVKTWFRCKLQNQSTKSCGRMLADRCRQHPETQLLEGELEGDNEAVNDGAVEEYVNEEENNSQSGEDVDLHPSNTQDMDIDQL